MSESELPIQEEYQPEIEDQGLILPDSELSTLESLATWSRRLGIFLITIGVINILGIFIFAIPNVIAGVFFIAMGTRLTSSAQEFWDAIDNKDGIALGSGLRFIRTFYIQNLVFYGLLVLFMILVVAMMAAFWPHIQELMREGQGFTT